MNKKEQIRLILYEAADQLAELLGEEQEPAFRPLYASKSNLASMFGICRQTVTKVINEAAETQEIGKITEGKRTKYSIREFERRLKN